MGKRPSLKELKQKISELEASYAEKNLEAEAFFKTNQVIGNEIEKTRSELAKINKELHKKSLEYENIKESQKNSEQIRITLINISNAVNTALNLDDLYHSIHHSLNQIMDVANFFIAIHDREKATFFTVYYMDEMDSEPPLNVKNEHAVHASLLTGRVLIDGAPVFIKKKEMIRRAKEEDKKIFGSIPEVWLGVPLKIKNKTIGVMATQSYTDPNRYNERDLQILTSVSEQVALAIEHKQAEEALRKSEERYRHLVENLDDIIFSMNFEGRFFYLSSKIETVTGYTSQEIKGRMIDLGHDENQDPLTEPSAVSLARQNAAQPDSAFERIIHPDDRKAVILAIRKAVRETSAYRVEYRIVKKNGRINWVQEKGISLQDPHGETRIEGIIQDIHEHRHAEEINRVLFGISNAVNTTVNLDELYKSIHQSLGRIVDTTNFFIALYHKERDSLFFPYVVNTVDNFEPNFEVDHVSAPDCASHSGEIIRSGKPVLHTKREFLRLLESRGLKPISTPSEVWLGVPLKIRDEVIGVMAVHSFTNPHLYNKKDAEILLSVSEQVALAIEHKRANEARKQSEEKYRTIIESIEDGYYEIDLKGDIVFFNDSMCRILHYNEEEMRGMNNRRYMDEKNAKKVFQMFNQMYRTGRPIKGFDFEVMTKDGNQRYINASASLIVNEQNQPIGFRGIARDITEHQLIEKEKNKLMQQLQRAQKMEAIGMLAGGVAHDLNNILAGLVSYPELLLLDLSEESPLRKPITTIQKAGEKAAAIVQDLLTLARRGVAVAEVVNLNQVVKEYLKSPVFTLLQTYHPNVKVEVDLESELLNVIGSPVHLTQTVMNLVSNAAEAMPDGGPIHISTTNQYVDQPIKGYDQVAEGDYATFRIADKGIGISPLDIDRIFEPFYTKKVMGRSGTGLGMAVVWGTVKDHHGYIDVQSTPHKGSTFTLYFPITRQDIREKDLHLAQQSYKGHGQSILVIDDVKEQREIAENILTRLGYAVSTVESGEEALLYLQDHQADLLVLDMVMDPGMDGLETYKKIILSRPGQKAVIVSGFSESDRVKELQKLGAGIYVKKPFLMQNLGLAIQAELAR